MARASLLSLGTASLLLLAACTANAPDNGEEPVSTATGGEQTDTSGEMMDGEETNGDVIIRYTDDGYSPSAVTVDTGTTVIFENESENAMWTASDVHPTHRDYAGTELSEHCGDANSDAFDACEAIAPGDSWSFEFGKAGTWGYHNHRLPAHTGTVTVR